MGTLRFGVVVCLGVLASSLATAGETWTYVDLVGRLTDLECLAVLPVPGEKCQQFSSYDRASRWDEKTQTILNPFANGDGDGIIRREGDLSVFAEMEGPGVIWRIWSANAGKGHVKILLDGAPEPAVDLPFHGYFDGKNPPFQGKALCHHLAGGWNSYVPIPFQKSCKIVAENAVVEQQKLADGKTKRVVVKEGWGQYYHFTYGLYPKDTVMPTFKLPLSADEMAALAKANEFLDTKCGTDPAGPRPGEATEEKTVEAEAGQTVRVLELAGPRAITALRLKLDLPKPPDDVAALRELCLRVTWDGEAEPAVWSPLGDFFGSTPGFKKHSSLPLGATDDGFYSLWYMPFAKSAVVELVNDGKEKRAVKFQITHAPLRRPIETLGRFHAKWHRDAFLPTEPYRNAKECVDWTMLRTTGRGRYLGVMLHVWNPRGGWWGEGDEKFFIDGEKFPSTFGTGSEDYFGYAWSSDQLFFHAYHNQPYNDGHGSRGHVCVNRWQISDNVPFLAAFDGSIEKYYPNSRPTLYACTVYWYLAPGGADNYKPLPVEERTGYCIPPPQTRFKGVLEGEEMKVLECTGGGAGTQELDDHGPGWSNSAHLWWTRAKPGDRLTLAVPVKEAGRYKFIVAMTKAGDYGIVQLSLDGAKLGDPIDLYNPGVVPTGPIDFGVRELLKGEHKLTLEIVGTNEKAVKNYMAGLDYVKLEPVK